MEESLPSRKLRIVQEAGYALLELLVALTMLIVVLSTLMVPMMTTQRLESTTLNYAAAQQQARTGLDAMVSQVRQAYNILDTSGNSVDFDVYIGSTAYRVFYECDIAQPHSSYRECMRLQVAAGSSLPPVSSGTIAIRNLTNGTTANPVFSFAPDAQAPYYMTATVQVPASDGASGGLTHTVTFSSGALMRNENVGN